MTKKNKITWISAMAIVVANMIGTGVFTSLGFQVIDIQNTWSIIILWSIGGIIALAGAFSYAELGAYYKKSGGEYHFLTELYNPLVGYLAGWVSLTAGFAAPVALAAMALGVYLGQPLGLDPKVLGISVVIVVGLIHSFSIKSSSLFQNTTTLLKLILIVGIILLGLIIAPSEATLNYSTTWTHEITLPAFAVALIFVTYSYSGWNAASYIVEEIQDPSINLPKALIRGTILVSILYVLLQFVFLRHIPIDQLAGKVEIGNLFSKEIFGLEGGLIISYMIAIFLISSISAMIWVGPRVTKVMADDYPFWSFLKSKKEVPLKAIWFQVLLSVILILSGTFEQVLLYCGFLLQLSSLLCIFGSFKIRKLGKKLPFKSPFHPIFPILFILINIWILVFLIKEKPFESLIGLTNILLGLLTYFISKKHYNAH